MQFVLVNSLLANDQDSLRRHLRIVRYAVIPLNHNAGMFCFVYHLRKTGAKRGIQACVPGSNAAIRYRLSAEQLDV